MSAPSINHDHADMLYNIYLECFTKISASFCILRHEVTKPDQLDGKLTPVFIHKQGDQYYLSLGENTPLVLKDNISSVKFDSIPTPRGDRHFINVKLKNERTPLILAGKEKEDLLLRSSRGCMCLLMAEENHREIRRDREIFLFEASIKKSEDLWENEEKPDWGNSSRERKKECLHIFIPFYSGMNKVPAGAARFGKKETKVGLEIYSHILIK